ncbi:MAG: hypothetical protein WC714_20080 [Candidatus Obscuribacterales bacterium]|jgi:hypothetical protein
MPNVIDLNVAPCLAPLMGAKPITIAAILEELSYTENWMSSGDNGIYRYSAINEVTRMRLLLASNSYGRESPEVQKVLRDMCFNFYMISKFESKNEWAQVLHCYGLLVDESKEKMSCCEYAQEAHENLGLTATA